MSQAREENPLPINPCDVTADMEQSRANILAEYGADAPNWFVDQMIQMERYNKLFKAIERTSMKSIKRYKNEENE